MQRSVPIRAKTSKKFPQFPTPDVDVHRMIPSFSSSVLKHAAFTPPGSQLSGFSALAGVNALPLNHHLPESARLAARHLIPPVLSLLTVTRVIARATVGCSLALALAPLLFFMEWSMQATKQAWMHVMYITHNTHTWHASDIRPDMT